MTAYKRSTGFSIYTYQTKAFYPFIDPKHLVLYHNPMSGCPSPIMNVTVNNVTQGLVFINERPAGYTSNCEGDNLMYTGIELCEIKVMGIFFYNSEILQYFQDDFKKRCLQYIRASNYEIVFS